MDIVALRKQLEIDEGIKHEIYLDHLGLPTFGIGHLVLETDAEHGAAVGTSVSEDRVNECFDQDVEVVLADCRHLYTDFDELPEEDLKWEGTGDLDVEANQKKGKATLSALLGDLGL